MKKVDLIAELRTRLDSMLWILTPAKCILHYPVLETVQHAELLKGLHWLIEIEPSFVDARRARRSVTEEMWQRYEKIGIDDLQEVILWAELSQRLRKKCKSPSRPKLFIKSRHDSILVKEKEDECKRSRQV